MKNQRITIFLVSFFILLGAGFFIFYYPAIKKNRQPELITVGKPGEQGIRPFKFLNQEGDTITESVLKGKVGVVEYFFTTCKGICPKMNENMAKVYQAYRNDNNVIILSHTVDPERDTVAAMKAYSLRFQADPKHWMFLTGTKKALYDQAYNSYMMTAVEERNPNIDEDFIHTQKFVLVDKKGKLRMRLNDNGEAVSYDGTDEKSVAQLIEDIKLLENEE